MNHQPFETWILEGSPLSISQDKDLREHLLTCQKCCLLSTSLTAVVKQIRTLPASSPKSGFTNRWKAQAADRQAKALEQQSRRFLYGIAILTVTLLVIVLLYAIVKDSPMSWLVGFMQFGVEAIINLRQIQHTVNTWMQIVPIPIQIAIWVPIATAFCLLGLTWVITLWRIPTQGVQVV